VIDTVTPEMLRLRPPKREENAPAVFEPEAIDDDAMDVDLPSEDGEVDELEGAGQPERESSLEEGESGREDEAEMEEFVGSEEEVVVYTPRLRALSQGHGESDDEWVEDSSFSRVRELAMERGARRRLCLPGCSCEQVRGRKCGCELRGDGWCSSSCNCDSVKCRSRRKE
jgi:hypothetical protein